MLTSSNQYLRPEYLTPLPTTLDAKKSPLALLAQTCSQIGADSPNTKLIQSTEKNKSSKSESSKTKSPSAAVNQNDVSVKSSFKPYESSIHREKTQSPEERGSSSSSGSRVRTPVTPKNNGSGLPNGRCNSNHSEISPRTSPAVNERKTPANDGNDTGREANTPCKSSDRTSSPHIPSPSNHKTVHTSSVLTSSTDPSIKDMPLGTFKPGSGMTPSSAYLGGYPTHGIPLPMDLMTSSLMSHHQALKSGALGSYLNYARMKGALSADSLVSVCRDPYCTGCSLSSHLLAAASAGGKTSTCPAGCTQCDHASKAPASYLSHNPAAAVYAHAQLAALAAASQLPYICNWIAGDASYCGKRFSSSEELLQHLRTHTGIGSMTETNAALSMLNSANLPPTHPLYRSYPTPPLSPLATARYHPYSKPSLLPPSLSSSALSNFPLGHPGLPAYLSPYSLYGPRLGAAPGMHP